MKTSPECFPCFFNQALTTLKILTADEDQIWRVIASISSLLPQMRMDVPPPAVSREIYRVISKITGVDDPYLDIKNRCTKLAMDHYRKLKQCVKASEDPLITAFRIAVAGNIIDFGINADFDFRMNLDQLISQDLVINDYMDFRDMLGKTQKLLFLGDNAGETVFDRVLIEEINKPVTYAVRERPVINDAVYEDAVKAGIDKIADVVSSGCDAPGTIIDLCSEDFLRVLRTSDLIISKGQGNYEGLSELGLPVFFLLKAKCPVVSKSIDVPQGSIIFMKSPNFINHGP